jgi:selenocysteine-specific elongation factor
MDIIIGTAGHIDHGKTSLIKALTGVDADRLPEEKKRGITIDLGFAELDLGDVRIGFVDVPGHEKFVKNMLAGASGIDAVLLIIAADESVMPQTREHFEICRLLGVEFGIIVLTKADMVDEELLEIVKLDVEELTKNSFLENSPIISVSSKTGFGIEDLKQTLREISIKIPPRKHENITRLPIDRVFSVKGFGAVVTGTLATGEIIETTEMEIIPSRKKVRVRGIQTHGKSVNKAFAGQRTAVNLGGIDYSEIERGMILSEPNIVRPTQIFDAEIEVLKDAKSTLKTRQRVRVHVGTIEALARIQVLNSNNEILQGEKDFVQIRLESEVVTVPNERFILRQYSPQITIAGGKVLDNSAIKHRKKEVENVRKYLANLLKSDKTTQLKLYLETANEQGLTFADLQARTGWRAEILNKSIAANVENKAVILADKFYVARTPFENLKAKTINELTNFHKKEPLAKGILRETLREKIFADLPVEIFRKVVENSVEIAVEKDIVRLGTHTHELTQEEKLMSERILKIYADAKLEVPTLDAVLNQSIVGTKSNTATARKIFQLFLNKGEIVKISEEFYFQQVVIDKLIKKLHEFVENSADRLIDMSTFKEIANVSRKYAIPLLEYFDQTKITKRAGDKRLIL